MSQSDVFTVVTSEDLNEFLANLWNYKKKPFLAKGVIAPQFDFGQIICIRNKFVKGGYFLKKIDYDRESAPRGIVIRETKERVGFVYLQAYVKKDYSSDIDYKAKHNVYKVSLT